MPRLPTSTGEPWRCRGHTAPHRAALAAVAESLADVLEMSGQFDDATAALNLARKSRQDRGDLVRLMRKEGVICERQGKYTQALRWYGRGLTASVGARPNRAGVDRRG